MMPRKRTGGAGHRRRLLVLLGVLLLIALAFLPGPNGLVRVLLKHRRAERLKKEITRLQSEIDSLSRSARQLRKPEFAREYARSLLGRETSDSAQTKRH